MLHHIQLLSDILPVSGLYVALLHHGVMKGGINLLMSQNSLYSFLKSKAIFCPPLLRSANRQLNFCQPIVSAFLVPDSVNIAFPGQAGRLIAVLFRVFHDKGIGFSDVIVRPFVIDAQHLRLRDVPEPDNIILNAPGCYSLVMPDLDTLSASILSCFASESIPSLFADITVSPFSAVTLISKPSTHSAFIIHLTNPDLSQQTDPTTGCFSGPSRIISPNLTRIRRHFAGAVRPDPPRRLT